MPLARFFAWLDRFFVPPTSGVLADAPGTTLLPPVTPAPEPWRSGCLFSVDGAGQFLLVAGARLTIGHARAGLADLPFLADVGPQHAELVREDSLHAGPGWCLRALHGERAEVEGTLVGPEGRRLAPGERVVLGGNLAFRFLWPDPSSDSACLELERGLECCGARRVLLLGEGAGGRLRLGSGRERHVRVANLEYEVVIEKRGERLWVRSSREGLAEESHVVHFPPPVRVDLALGAPHGSRPPFGFSFEPLLRSPLAPERDPGG